MVITAGLLFTPLKQLSQRKCSLSQSTIFIFVSFLFFVLFLLSTNISFVSQFLTLSIGFSTVSCLTYIIIHPQPPLFHPTSPPPPTKQLQKILFVSKLLCIPYNLTKATNFVFGTGGN
jgi:hypothetical protein